MAGVDDTLQGLNIISSVIGSTLDYNLAQDKLQKTAELNRLVEVNKVAAEQRKNNLTDRRELLRNEREDNETEIAGLTQYFRDWNTNATDWIKLDDKWQTPEGEEMLKNQGVEAGEDFKLRVMFANDSNTQLQYTENLLNLQREIIDKLSSKKNQITKLNDDLMNVGTEAGMKKIKGIEDIKVYMGENREKFGIPKADDLAFENIDWSKDVNPLGKVFMKQRLTPSGKGFWATPTQAQMKAAGLSTKDTSYGIPSSEVIEKETRMNLNTDFNTIKGTISDIKQEHSDKGKVYSEWLDELDLDNFLDLKGSEKLWDKDPMALKTKVEGKILAMVNKSTKAGTIESWLGTNEVEHENIRKLAKLTPAVDIGSTDIDESLSLLTAQPLNRYLGVKNLHERWLGGDVEVSGKDAQGNPMTYNLPKTKVGGAPGIGASGLFNQEYALDKMYHDDYPSGDKFGTTSEDKLLYDLLSMWKKLDTFAPTNVPQSLR